MVRILLVDDLSLMRQGLRALLEPIQNLEVVGNAEDGQSALERVATLRPDVVLMGLEMLGMSGIAVTQQICQQFPKTKVLVLSSHENYEYAAKALQAGAVGYLPKNISAEALEQAIWSAFEGRSQVEPKLLRALAAASLSPAIAPNNIGAEKPSLRDEANQIDDKYRTKVEADNSEKLPSSNQSIHKSILKPEKTEEKVGTSRLFQWGISGAIAVSILLIAIPLISLRNRTEPQPVPAAPVSAEPEIEKVAALGRIEPLGEVMSLSAPTSLEAVQVERLLVEVGDRVEQGQIVAILDGRQRQQAALEEAQTQVAVSRAQLAKVKAGAKPGAIRAREAAIVNLEAELAGEVQTQQATIAKLDAELANARTELQRNQRLYDDGAISASELDSKKLTFRTAAEQLKEAKATLERTQSTLDARLAEARATLEETAEVRPVDVEIAQAELNQAQATVARAQADMELAYVRAPVAGEILDIHTRPGEALNERGIAEIGQTERMMVVAEIDQNDINRVKLGQPATVTSGVFPETLQGKVHQVGSLIRKNDILNTDPAADEDSRVVEVEILLEPKDSQKVAKLTNLEVDVVIEI